MSGLDKTSSIKKEHEKAAKGPQMSELEKFRIQRDAVQAVSGGRQTFVGTGYGFGKIR